jgi:hypothetical protein
MRIVSKYLFAIAAGFALSACQASPPEKKAIAKPTADAATSAPKSDQPVKTDTCGAKTYAWVVGKSKDRIPPAPSGKVVRVVCTTCMMTMDFNAERVNIFFDRKTGLVTRLSCG